MRTAVIYPFFVIASPDLCPLYLETATKSLVKRSLDGRIEVTNACVEQYNGRTCFDYSTNDGVVPVIVNDIAFSIYFSKASDTRIHIYKDHTALSAVARLKNVQPGDQVNFHTFDSTSRAYTVHLGEYFMVRNNDGYFLLGRVLSIKDDTRDDKVDEVCFSFAIGSTKSGQFKAI